MAIAIASSSASATTLPSLCTPASSSAAFRRSPSQVSVFSKPFSIAGARIFARSSSFNPRCDAVSQKKGIPSNPISSTSSPFELLKSSKAERHTEEKSSIIAIARNIHMAPVEIYEKLAILEA